MKKTIKKIIIKLKNKISDKKKIRDLKKELKETRERCDYIEERYLKLEKEYNDDLLVLQIRSLERALRYSNDRVEYLRKENKELSKENQEYRKLLNKVGE